jgi:hypothetical protein
MESASSLSGQPELFHTPGAVRKVWGNGGMEGVDCDGDGCVGESGTSLSLLTRILSDVDARRTVSVVKSVLRTSC